MSTFQDGPDALMVFEEMANDDASMNSMDVQDVDMQVAGDDEQTEESPWHRLPSPAKGIDPDPRPRQGSTSGPDHRRPPRSGGRLPANATGYSGGPGIPNATRGWIPVRDRKVPDYRAAATSAEAFVRAGHRFPGPFVTAYAPGAAGSRYRKP